VHYRFEISGNYLKKFQYTRWKIRRRLNGTRYYSKSSTRTN